MLSVGKIRWFCVEYNHSKLFMCVFLNHVYVYILKHLNMNVVKLSNIENYGRPRSFHHSSPFFGWASDAYVQMCHQRERDRERDHCNIIQWMSEWVSETEEYHDGINIFAWIELNWNVIYHSTVIIYHLTFNQELFGVWSTLSIIEMNWWKIGSCTQITRSIFDLFHRILINFLFVCSNARRGRNQWKLWYFF